VSEHIESAVTTRTVEEGICVRLGRRRKSDSRNNLDIAKLMSVGPRSAGGLMDDGGLWSSVHDDKVLKFNRSL
jgi:hypothetical protein